MFVAKDLGHKKTQVFACVFLLFICY
ncbi:hypothetical protein PTD2_13129 [Pseudoalteromonas tunicata D2]|uniref:Uncharacterized protein n=1 Tax=Pseudoalteromonas tunicata D2 TaxID=87626 RepID=A4C710_9GAMM|nr:hypothetical protein PTD2_13129 [Pseudoalteromonas tunicata D2]